MSFSYTRRDGVATERYVEPYRLVVLSRRWYLLAFDVDRDDWRNFRVDRIERRARDRRPVRPARGARRSGRVRARLDRAHAARTTTWSSTSTAPADVVERADRALVDGRAARRRRACRVRMTADDLEWPVLALAQLDADFTVVAPPELRRAGSRALARRFAGAAD